MQNERMSMAWLPMIVVKGSGMTHRLG